MFKNLCKNAMKESTGFLIGSAVATISGVIAFHFGVGAGACKVRKFIKEQDAAEAEGQTVQEK